MDAYDKTAREFFRTVLEIDYDECIVTDESRLSDFASCGLPDDIADAADGLKELYAAWDVWVVPEICSRYGLEDVSPTILLIDLFERIEKQRLDRLH